MFFIKDGKIPKKTAWKKNKKATCSESGCLELKVENMKRLFRYDFLFDKVKNDQA